MPFSSAVNDPAKPDSPKREYAPENAAEAWRVAELVHSGMAAKAIAIQILGCSKEKELNTIRRRIRQAFRLRYLTLKSPDNKDILPDLHQRFPAVRHFHVVNNISASLYARAADPSAYADVVCRKGAEVVAAGIAEAIRRKSGRRGPVVIANAGGFAISRVARFLSEFIHPLQPSAASRLLFISLNDVSVPDNYGLSANYLAVQMGTVYHAGHIVHSPIWPAEVAEKYAAAVADIDLLICGAGSQHGSLFKWLHRQKKIVLPKNSVGDICLSPLLKNGDHAMSGNPLPKSIVRELKPNPGYETLRRLADADKIIYIATGFEHDDIPRDTENIPRFIHSKLAITRAILSRPLAATCVLGDALAADLLKPEPP